MVLGEEGCSLVRYELCVRASRLMDAFVLSASILHILDRVDSVTAACLAGYKRVLSFFFYRISREREGLSKMQIA